jgi:hypothetical protein
VRSFLLRSHWPLPRDLHGRDTGSAIAVPKDRGVKVRRGHCKFAVPSRGRKAILRAQASARAVRRDFGALPMQGLEASRGQGRARLACTPALPGSYAFSLDVDRADDFGNRL